MPVLRVVGPGRAGSSLARALDAAGWTVLEPVRRGEDVTAAATGVDLVVIATPDAAVPEVASSIEPVGETVVAHLAGSLGLDVLAPHVRRAAVHPLRSLPTTDTDLNGAWFAVAGDPLGEQLVEAIGGKLVRVAPAHRAAYHAAACIASNPLVALLGQVERVAGSAGVSLDAYLDLVRQTVDNVAALGPADALTGPVRRGDDATIAGHLAAIDPSERPAYRELAALAKRLCAVGSGEAAGTQAQSSEACEARP